MWARSPAPSSTDGTERCYSFTLVWENQGQLPVCLKPQQWEAIFEAAAMGIAGSLLLGFLVAATRHKLWHHSGTLKSFLDFVSDTLYSWLGHFAILVQALYANNSIIWTVLLFATYGCFYSVLGYSLYGHDKKKAILTHERKQLANNSFVLVLLLLVTDYTSEISRILFVIWGLSMLKIIGRIFSFRAAEKSYGTANTKLVALYMKHQHEQGAPFDPSKMEGYEYLVIGEKQQAEAEPPSYEPKLRNDAAVTTVGDVWRCDGKLFKGSSGGGQHRDMCLSFALFKLIKMRFDGYPQVEDEGKSRALVRDGLLSEDDDGKRAFEVVKSELGFLRDLFHTKHPVASNPWILICNFVLFATIAMALWIAMTIDRKTNAEHPITKVLVSLLILAEMWEFISYLFSDWGKVILICKYVKNYRPAFDRWHVDKILRVILWRNLSCRSLYEKLEQFSLLNSLKSCCTCSRCCCYLLAYCRLPAGASRKLNQRLRKEKPIRLKAEVKKAISLSLKKLLASEIVVLTNGITTLAELGHDEQLGWACGIGDHEHTHMHTIMIWHVATALCEMQLPPKKKKGEGQRSSELESRAAVANSLSKYCAYLVVFAPDLLPIHGHSSKIMFKKMLAEACTACSGGICRKITYDNVENVEDSDPTIISKGVKLGRQLMSNVKEDAERWKLLERFWVELILFLAPSKDAMAHASKLAEGGEFITHLWALLYHARVEERSPEKKKEHAGEHV